ncbi:MAG: aminotransferase class IV [Flavobacteriaceae bacterium]|jgi:4-amino-4-deoxychorismate lyase|nr:aminotransferase class IV [Flavobacteriaceae bacterium]
MKPQFSEAIKFKNGVFYNLSYHQARVNKTLEKFGGGEIDLAKALSEMPVPVQQGIFKCRVVYGKSIETIEFAPYSFRRIATIGMVESNDIEYGYKYTNRNMLNKLLKQTGCDDMIIIRQGFTTDAFASNLVFESSEGLFTPDTCLLPGTKRRFLLDTGKITEKRITARDIQSYSQIRFINAMIDLEDNICIEVKKLFR